MHLQLFQLSGLQIALRGELAALLLFGAQSGVGVAQLLLKSSVGPSEEERKKALSHQEKKVTKEIRPNCSAVGPNLGDYSPRVRQRAPVEKEKDLLRLSDKSAAVDTTPRLWS